MADSKKIRFAVVGCGHIGKRHAVMIQRNPESELIAMVDVRPKSECGMEDFQDVPFFQSIEDLLASNLEYDVVNICTPNGVHAEQSIKALQASHHVVCEKPMGLNKDQCEKIIYTALQHSKQVFCVMQNRYSPPSEWIKEVVSNRNYWVTFIWCSLNCYWNRDERYYKKGGWKGTSRTRRRNTIHPVLTLH
jgi:UDP-N-acetyl-2-amino-2-deoxyglucuronate dehydrogenase